MRREKSKIFYVCGVDWQHEIGEADPRFYKSIRRLKRVQKCWKECGIVEIKMTAKWRVPQNLKGA